MEKPSAAKLIKSVLQLSNQLNDVQRADCEVYRTTLNEKRC